LHQLHHSSYFFFMPTSTSDTSTLSLHDALPICSRRPTPLRYCPQTLLRRGGRPARSLHQPMGFCGPSQPTLEAPGTRQIELRERSEEHTSELQSLTNLVCRPLLQQKNLQVSPST